MFECPQEGKGYRFPITDDKMINRQEVRVAKIAIAIIIKRKSSQKKFSQIEAPAKSP